MNCFTLKLSVDFLMYSAAYHNNNKNTHFKTKSISLRPLLQVLTTDNVCFN